MLGDPEGVLPTQALFTRHADLEILSLAVHSAVAHELAPAGSPGKYSLRQPLFNKKVFEDAYSRSPAEKFQHTIGREEGEHLKNICFETLKRVRGMD